MKVIIKDKNTGSHEVVGLKQVTGTKFGLAQIDRQLRGDVGKVNGFNMADENDPPAFLLAFSLEVCISYIKIK